MKLQGRRAIVTGAGSGLGAAIARRCAANGAALVLAGRRRDALAAVAREIESAGGKAVVCPADIAREGDVARLVAIAAGELGGIDVLVNNAGVNGPFGTIDAVDWPEWRAAFEINFFGAVNCCRLALPHLRQARRGKIVLISGGGATAPLPKITAYGAAKAALVRYAESLALEVADTIDVNCVAPGAMKTQITAEYLEKGRGVLPPEFLARIEKLLADGGAPPEKAADLVVYLASGESDGLSGKLISAVWDPWPFDAAARRALMASETYTLRRVVPKD
ncbi:MAG TPA: SDR family oxidoreductase [Alphaproteobacteria bacterium]|jgi:NAD(P)-dependent dehydrogenase (short-subunit alcohol dehydrogenase family)